jgi:pimeloyl-ACP methyl ester carboxylesterase
MKKIKLNLPVIIFALLFVAVPTILNGQGKKSQPVRDYAAVNGLRMYYEIHGEGKPLILLHGAYMTIEGPFRELINQYASTRRVIVPELQAHGRTADIDRDITYESLADDVSALIAFLNLDSADVLGYSMGGAAAMQLAIRHPKQVKKLVLVSTTYSSDGIQPAFLPMVPNIKPEMFTGSPFKMQYDSLAPTPENFPVLVEKLKKLDMQSFNWEEAYAKIKNPVMLIFGDSDIATIDHIANMFKKLGGNVPGDMAPLPPVQLAILPATTHLGMMNQLGSLQPMVSRFLTEN